ncbi:MAG TPA: helix-turn-helix domain-containing protein [Novosphingobium sp.]|nr:helix-turn-helix domain-containing protein [Novosphingobium sp.]
MAFTVNDQRRNRNYTQTHRSMIEQAVDLIARDGVDALSVAALAREAGMNRSTVYYHFESREALLAEVKAWSRDQLAMGFHNVVERRQRADGIVEFVLGNPEIVKLWIDDFVAPGDIRDRYPQWDEMVARIDRTMRDLFPKADADAEVWGVMLLTASLIAPRVFKNSVSPGESDERIVERFGREQQLLMSLDLYRPVE